MKKRVRYITVAIAGILGSILFSFLYHTPLPLYPENTTYFEFTTIYPSDTANTPLDSVHGHRHSGYQLDETDSTVKLLFHAHELARTIDIGKYHYFQLETAAERKRTFSITLYLFLPGFSDPVNMATHRPYSFRITLDSTENIIRLPLEDFATPVLWFSEMGVSHEDLPPTDWKQMTHMTLNNISLSGAEEATPQLLAITGLSFRSSLMRALLISGISVIVIMLVGVKVEQLIQARKTARVKKRIYANQQEGLDEHSSELLITYLQEQYGNPFLTLEQIEKELHLTQFQVNSIIRTNFAMGYKQFLNQLRMEKAKQLLRETDLPIATVGEKVGYLHPNSFARTFRNSESCSPKEYRNKYSS